jgi:hypothetical protein
MIKVYPTSPSITVNYSTPYLSVAMSTPAAGQVYYDTTTSELKVFTGANWIPIGASLSVGLDNASEEALTWAKRKIAEEAQLEELMQQHPGLRDLKEKFDIMLALVKTEESYGP